MWFAQIMLSVALIMSEAIMINESWTRNDMEAVMA
jgi:hypothetical protein